MLRDFVNKLEEMAFNEVKPELVEIDGVNYVKSCNGFEILKDIRFDDLGVNTLSSVVKSVLSLLDSAPSNVNKPFVVNVQGNKVCIYSNLSRQGNRELLVTAHPETPYLELGSYMPVETMLIRLSTAFEPTENTEALIKALSNIRIVEEVEFKDDGIGQAITAKKGATAQKYELPPIVALKPIRTYFELEQVESKYLLRVDGSGRVALFEADGGAWKYEAQKRIVDYLEHELSEEIESDVIKILG